MDRRPDERRRGTWGICLLFAGLCGFFGFTAHGYLENSDADLAMHSARAILHRGNPGLLRAGPDTTAAERYVAGVIHAGPTGLGRVGTRDRVYTFGSIGYQVALVPCVALGEICTAVWPGPERRLNDTGLGVFREMFWARFWISFVPAVAAAGSAIALLLVSRRCGASRREALLVVAVATLCTQFWPGARETMADGLGMCFLLAGFAATLEFVRGLGSRLAAGAAGAFAGAAVLIRYPHAVPVAVLAGWLVVVALRRRRFAALAWFAGGALPFAGLLALFNLWCFGDATATGYAGATSAWWSHPLHLGVPLILFAPGKGVMWFSPLLWLALAVCIGTRLRSAPLAIALAVFAATTVLYGRTLGWAAGQCWSIRYMTPTVVLLVVVGLSVGKPWRAAPKRFVAVCALGLAVSLGGLVTSYRGHQLVAQYAARIEYARELDAGVFPLEHLNDRINYLPSYSPLHTHWVYAWQSAQGRLGHGPLSDARAVFGVTGERAPEPYVFPAEERGFGHFWWNYLARFVALPKGLVVTVWLVVTALLLAIGGAAWISPPRRAPAA